MTRSLALDAHGKSLSSALLEMEIPDDESRRVEPYRTVAVCTETGGHASCPSSRFEDSAGRAAHRPHAALNGRARGPGRLKGASALSHVQVSASCLCSSRHPVPRHRPRYHRRPTSTRRPADGRSSPSLLTAPGTPRAGRRTTRATTSSQAIAARHRTPISRPTHAPALRPRPRPAAEDPACARASAASCVWRPDRRPQRPRS